MGLFQNLLESYEKCSDVVGIVRTDADGNSDERKTLLPIFHMTFKSEICVTIDSYGKFISASRDGKETTIIIPCTESSSGRSSGIASHPLCDQLDYVGGINDDKIDAYLTELSSWKDDIVELNAVYTYVSGRTIMNDLMGIGIFKDSEYQVDKNENADRQLEKDKIRKIGVRFTIQIDGDFINVWESLDLRNAWINYICCKNNTENLPFDYMSGDIVGSIATQHPKNINSITVNARLFSCNESKQDSDGAIVFKGRFTKQDDAVIVDYTNSQKMHQMLRWLIKNYGYRVDSQAIITWAVDNNTDVKAKSQDNSFELFGSMQEVKTEADILEDASSQIYADYSSKLKNLLQGYGNVKSIKEHSRKICIAAFDAATTGRMGVVFYQELSENDYIESIVNWHNDTSYFLTAWKSKMDKDGNDKNIPINYIGAPSYDDIIFAVYGNPHDDKSHKTLIKKTRQQLLECMFGNFGLPKSMVEIAANRASHPMSFTDMNGKFNENDWKRAISITCALTRKFFKQQKEEIQLELDTSRTDRDYLFGRLLSVADKLEHTALYKADKQDTRATNATRLMSAFQAKPYSTWGQLYNQLIPYRNQLNGAGFYQSLIDSIIVLFNPGEYENNSPLSPLYLLGYSAQNRALSKNNKNDNMEGTDNDSSAE
ncbi:MAG: type I-C CRISPR-associated protein Cas8c/Csd1 [Eubacteriales bacterium]|nr:type I-C CRISPR-associated protein Cas8c/Csd1 [Eubacteriales bacterium]